MKKKVIDCIVQKKTKIKKTKACAIVAHPDDETLWAGGTILSHSQWDWYIISLCRGDDKGRSEKFYRVLEYFNASGTMGSLDDSPQQHPLCMEIVEKEILKLLPHNFFDLIVSHDPNGEYTRHRRHEEVGICVSRFLKTGILTARNYWTFAYEDGNKKHLPRVKENADYIFKLPKDIWLRKYEIITKIYGFEKSSFEARTTPRKEAFNCKNYSYYG
jgi:hypothetical protein